MKITVNLLWMFLLLFTLIAASGKSLANDNETSLHNPKLPGVATVTFDRKTEALNYTPIIDQTILNEFEESLRYDLLYPYYPDAEDIDSETSEYYGFIEDRTSTWVPNQDDDKFVVAQARYTWTAAKASEFYAHDPDQSADYLDSAAVGFSFLQKMWGYDYGGGRIGIAMLVDRDGSDKRVGNKGNHIVYGHAFALYAASAYYAASGEQDALDLAVDCYNFLETNMHDPTYGGYYKTEGDQSKNTNVNMHVLEALVEFYQALPLEQHILRTEVAQRITELLNCFYNDAIHYGQEPDCFAYTDMDRYWTPKSGTNNKISFGHDVELAFLMIEAITALGYDPLTSDYFDKIEDMVNFTLTHDGYRNDGALYYIGAYNYTNGDVTVTNDQLGYWVQAEGLNTLCLMRMLYPNDSFYSDNIDLTWDFIKNNFIDQTERGWLELANQTSYPKANEWFANYHAGRAMMNCLDWLSHDLTMAVNPTDGGSTIPEVGIHRKARSSDVNITATPETGYEFNHWTGNVADPVSASTIVTMNGDKTVTANFNDIDDSDEHGQIWYLDNDPTMYREVTDNPWGTATIGDGEVIVWLSDETAVSDYTFAAGTWQGQLALVEGLEDGDQFTVTIGTSDGSSFSHGVNDSQTFTGDGRRTIFPINIEAGSFMVNTCHYLALRIENLSEDSNDDLNVMTGLMNSYCEAPVTESSFPLPELASVALMSIGLAMMGTFVWLRSKRYRDRSRNR